MKDMKALYVWTITTFFNTIILTVTVSLPVLILD